MDIKMETQPRLEEPLFRRILLYHTTMAAIKNMLKSGAITKEEYALVDQKMAEKYGLGESVIFR